MSSRCCFGRPMSPGQERARRGLWNPASCPRGGRMGRRDGSRRPRSRSRNAGDSQAASASPALVQWIGRGAAVSLRKFDRRRAPIRAHVLRRSTRGLAGNDARPRSRGPPRRRGLGHSTNTPAYATSGARSTESPGATPPTRCAHRSPSVHRDELVDLFEEAGCPDRSRSRPTTVGRVSERPLDGRGRPARLVARDRHLRPGRPDRIHPRIRPRRPLSPDVTGQAKLRFDSPAHIVTGNRPPTTP